MLITVPYGEVTLPADFDPQKCWDGFLESPVEGLRFVSNPRNYSVVTALQAGRRYFLRVVMSVAPPTVAVEPEAFSELAVNQKCVNSGIIGFALAWKQDRRLFEESAHYHVLAEGCTYYIASLGNDGTFLGRNSKGVAEMGKFMVRMVVFSEEEFSI